MILTILRVLFLRIRNNPLELALLFVMPVVFFSIFAGIFSKGIATGNDKQLRVGWIASHPTALGAELRGFLDTQSTLQCTSLMAESSPQVPTGDTHENAIEPIQIEATIAEAQRSGRYDLIIRLPDNFPFEMTDDQDSSPCSVQLVTDGQNPIAVAMVTSIVRSFFAEKKLAATAKRMMSLSLAEQSSSRLRGSSSPNQRDVGNAGSKLPPLSAESRSSTSRRRYLDPVKDPSQVFKSDPESPWLVMDSKGAYSVEGVSSGSGAQALALPPNVFTTVDTPGTTRTETTKSTDVENVSISIQNPQAANQENPRIAMYAAGIAVLFLLFSSTGHAAALLEEAESGTLDRILVSQAGLFHIIGGKWLGILLLGCLQITVMFVWAELVFGIQLADHVPGFCIMTFSTAAATASFAMLMATLCKSRAQLNAVSIVLILSMSAVGGSMIPRFVMSDRMKEIGRWTFNAWALDGYQKVFWFQAPLTSLWAEVAVLLGSSLVLGLLALRFSGRRKRS